MDCKYFSKCGACVAYEDGYNGQLNEKLNINIERFLPFYEKNISLFSSKDSHYRARSEFKIWHDGDEIFYAMNNIEKNGVILVDECPQVNETIFALMPKLMEKLRVQEIGFKLFGVDFLSSSHGEVVVSLLYHRKLDAFWQEKATKIAVELKIHIIGRSRNQKVVIGQDFVTEKLKIKDEEFSFKHIENSFTQPNPSVNEQMIAWALEKIGSLDNDLLELYCGAGNFTIPFAKKFRKVLATEISKSSISAAKENMALNGVSNIEFVRMDVAEFIQALDGAREFRRMREIDLSSYEIKTIFVDPPRSGMDAISCAFASRFENILYISCNPVTLARDLELLCATHEVEDLVLFDQFPYTKHVEVGAKLIKRSIL